MMRSFSSCMFIYESHDNIDGAFSISYIASFTDKFIVADFNGKLIG